MARSKLQFFTVHPQHLHGLLTVTEGHQLEALPNNSSSCISIFTASEPVGQKFTRLADQSQGQSLSLRCALLQLWANCMNGILIPAASVPAGNKLREHFRQLVGRLTEAELSESSLDGLASELHCSERHFSRLFREEFGVPFRARQIELRLQRARQLLTESNAKIINVAYDSGYRHLGLFNAMFKKRFGVTPSEWRQKNIVKKSPSPPKRQITKLATRVGIVLAMLGLIFVLPARAHSNPPAEISKIRAVTRLVTNLRMAELTGEKYQTNVPALAPITNIVSPTAVTNAKPGVQGGKIFSPGKFHPPPGRNRAHFYECSQRVWHKCDF
ncbi:MAG: helix-turn-helix transcriptional regulator [Limisphaerales bacterium]